jgi:hypothetical protein
MGAALSLLGAALLSGTAAFALVCEASAVQGLLSVLSAILTDCTVDC